MQRERWQRLERLFGQGLTLPETERAAWLARACCDDAQVRREVEDLLRANSAPGVLDTPPLALTDIAQATPIPASLAAGTRVGAWRIEKLVGRGGTGEVYAATRAEVAFTQLGALKLLRFEAIGEVARFDAERRILARLDHPGISRLLDGGIAQDGRPYTVMEYVEGVSLIDYCATRRATLAERLSLFGQVCDALAYAHRNLVVHRDLKPSNTLVDAEGKVKLLDFGIAKLLDADTPEQAAAATTCAPFTPEYAAPEQLSGEAVTTASDVYSLGVLLFELLTGERPLQSRGMPFGQLLALLDDRAPPLPSRIARDRAHAPLPCSALVGDLDAIVAKCLRREPALRYASVNDLKRDLQHHLAREPVVAREGARLYVVGRLLRRYRWGVAAAATLIVALAAGLAGTLWQAHQASMHARTATAVQTFVTDLFRANSSNQQDPVKARATSARDLLDIGARKIDAEMDDAPAAKLDVINLLGDLYDELALHEEEVALRRQAVELTRHLHGAAAPELVIALVALAGAMHGTDIEAEREPVLREALASLDRNGDSTSKLRGILLQKFAEFYENSDQAKALDYAQQSVHLLAAYPPSAELAEAWYLQGLTQTYTGRSAMAVDSLNHAIDVSAAVQGVPNPKLIIMYYQLADTQRQLHDFAAAARSATQALNMALSVNGEDHIDAVRTRMMLGKILIEDGRVGEGLDLLARAKRGVYRLLGESDPFHTPAVLEANGFARSDVGDITEGLADLESAVAIRHRFEGDSLQIANLKAAIAADLIDLGRYDDARRAIDEAGAICETLACARATPAHYTRILNSITTARVRLAEAEGRMDDARKLLATLVFTSDPNAASRLHIVQWLNEAEIAMDTHNVAEEVATPLANARTEIERRGIASMKLAQASADLIEGRSYLKRHNATAALPPLQRARDAREGLLIAPNPRLSEARALLAICYLQLGQPNAARELAASAALIDSHYAQLGERYRKPIRELQLLLQVPSKPTRNFAARGHG